MRNNVLFFILFILIGTVFSEAKVYSEIDDLNYTIEDKQKYTRQKEERISALEQLASKEMSLLQHYELNRNLYKEYQKFKIDSAIFYVKRNLGIAEELKNESLLNSAKIQLITLYSSSGNYRESENILKSIDKKSLSEKLIAEYYDAYYQFFSHYAANNSNETYLQQISLYRDSLLSVLDHSSLKYKITLAEQDIDKGEFQSAEKSLLILLGSVYENPTDYAMITYLLGRIYEETGNIKQAKKYYTFSSTTDIKNSIKDNASIQFLSLIYYNEGNIDQAYRCTQSAIEDALFCNVQFRTLQMSEFYTIINTAYKEKEAKRKSELQFYLILISILSLFLILAVIYVYRQMKKVSRIREELFKTNEKLIELNNDISQANEQLNERNVQLSESDRIKEEYIAHFFDLCSAYINKLENYRLALNKKATVKQLDELFKMLKSTTVVDNEYEELYKNFDNIFLNLYPTFVKDFNSLLEKEEQVVLKPGELLNTELRIYALLRLGITDSVKIAAFLRYSISTIYNYRTKIRNRAAVSRDEFEEMVMKIGIMSSKA